jgi:hypothetical protein
VRHATQRPRKSASVHCQTACVQCMSMCLHSISHLPLRPGLPTSSAPAAAAAAAAAGEDLACCGEARAIGDALGWGEAPAAACCSLLPRPVRQPAARWWGREGWLVSAQAGVNVTHAPTSCTDMQPFPQLQQATLPPSCQPQSATTQGLCTSCLPKAIATQTHPLWQQKQRKSTAAHTHLLACPGCCLAAPDPPRPAQVPWPPPAAAQAWSRACAAAAAAATPLLRRPALPHPRMQPGSRLAPASQNAAWGRTAGCQTAPLLGSAAGHNTAQHSTAQHCISHQG